MVCFYVCLFAPITVNCLRDFPWATTYSIGARCLVKIDVVSVPLIFSIADLNFVANFYFVSAGETMTFGITLFEPCFSFLVSFWFLFGVKQCVVCSWWSIMRCRPSNVLDDVDHNIGLTYFFFWFLGERRVVSTIYVNVAESCVDASDICSRAPPRCDQKNIEIIPFLSDGSFLLHYLTSSWYNLVAQWG